MIILDYDHSYCRNYAYVDRSFYFFVFSTHNSFVLHKFLTFYLYLQRRYDSIRYTVRTLAMHDVTNPNLPDYRIVSLV